MRPLRVLVASEPMEYGVLSYLERLFEGLDGSRCEAALAYSPHRMSPQAKTLLARLGARGTRVCRLPFRRATGTADVGAAFRLAAEIRAFRPDIMHVHSTKAGLIGRPLARLLAVPVLYTPHGTSWHYTGRIIGRVQRTLERALRHYTDVLLSVCPEEASAFVREIGFDPARVCVVRNGVRVPEPDQLAAMRQRMRMALGIAPHERWLLFVGRMTREKGLDILLRALDTGTAVDGLLAVGNGPERARLEAEAGRGTVPVRFCGYQPDVSPFLAAADVFVQPSRCEGLPFALLEAMAHGLPVVCADVGGVRGAVEQCGRIVPPNEPAALAESLRELGRCAELRATLGAAGRARAAKEFGVQAMLAAIQDAYESASAARTAPRGAELPVRASVRVG